MKKILPIVIIGILLLSGLGVITTQAKVTKYEKITISFSNPLIKENDEYLQITITEANSYLLTPKKPMLPMYTQTFTFPFGTKIKTVTCTPKNIDTKPLTKNIILAPEPVLTTTLTKQETITESNIYLDNYPDTWYEYEVTGGKVADAPGVMVNLYIYPVKYIMAENKIEWTNQVEITIEYENPHQATTFYGEYPFLILAPSSYTSQLENLVSHKNSRDISTKLVTLDEIYSGTYFPVQGRADPEKIKYFIKNSIENWGTSSVLLVGNSDDFPTRETHIQVSQDDAEIFVSDLYYADIYNGTGAFSSWDTNDNDIFAEYKWGGTSTDQMDCHPDVSIGRLACNDENELTTCIDKIISYEENTAYLQSWFSNLIAVGGDSFSDDHDILEGEYVNDAVIDVMDGFIPTRLWASNEILGKVSPSGVASINNAINGGSGFVDFSGHGATNIWATHPYKNFDVWLPTPLGGYHSSDVKRLTNIDKLPIVVTGACSVSKYNKDENSFSWSFLSNPYGGAIASFGATGLGYAYTGTAVTSGLIEGMSLETFRAYKNGAITVGEIWTWAINNYIMKHKLNDGGQYKTVLEWQLFGDPTLAIGEKSQPPVKPATPSGPTSGSVGTEYTYTTATTDPDGDKISYMFDWGDGTFSGWVGPFSNGATVYAKKTWDVKGTYQVKVVAKDIHGILSVWSDPLPITMPYAYNPMLRLLELLFQRFPNAFPILRQIMGY